MYLIWQVTIMGVGKDHLVMNVSEHYFVLIY